MDWISVGVVLVVGIMGIGSTITAYKLGRAQGQLEASMQHIDLIIKRPGAAERKAVSGDNTL